MPKVNKADKGYYTCVVRNEYGSINFTVEVDVIGKSFSICSFGLKFKCA